MHPLNNMKALATILSILHGPYLLWLCIVLFVLAICLFGWLQYKRGAFAFTRNGKKAVLGRDLQIFSSFCHLHALYAAQKLQHYTFKKGNEFDAGILLQNSKNELQAIHTENYFKQYAALVSSPCAARITSVLVDLLHRLRENSDAMNERMKDFPTRYDAATKTFYSNLYDLTQLYDELKEYVRGKNLNKPSIEWLHGFFAIFEGWSRSGGIKEMEVLQRDIVIKVIELNSQHAGNAFSSKTNEKALRCQFAYDKVTELDHSLYRKLQSYTAIYRHAARITQLIGRNMLPFINARFISSTPATIPVNNNGRKQRMMISAGCLLIIAACFTAGLYTGYRLFHQQSRIPAAANINEDPSRSTSTTVRLPATSAGATDHFPLPDSVQTVYGLDISRYQGDLLQDIHRLDTVHFVIVKATEGSTLIDPDFTTNWQRLQQLKLIRGAYHFYKAKDDPVQQGKHFLQTVGNLTEHDIPMVVDIEAESIADVSPLPDLSQHLSALLQYLSQQTGRRPIIYTNLDFANEFLRQEMFADYPLWLAEYSRQSSPLLPQAWKTTGQTFWQKNDSLTIHSHKTDFDVFNGNAAAFKAFLKKSGRP